MAINKNFVVKNGLEVGDQLIHADDTTAKVGIGSTQPNVELDVRGGIAATNTTVSGVSTVQTALKVGSGVAGTVFTALDTNLVGVGTADPTFLLDVRSPGAGTTALYVQGDGRFTGDLDVGAGVSVAGLSTFAGIGTFYEGFISAGIATVKQLEVIGFSTLRANVDIAADVGITSTLVVGAGLSVAGISTLTGLTDLNGGLDVTGVSTFANNVDINADVDVNRSLVVTGGASVTGLSTFTGNVDINSDVDINRSLAVTGGATVTGLSTFSSNVDINADADVLQSLIIGGGINVSGIGTIGRVKIFNEGTGAAVTATSGIVTYYGDGQYLTNIQSGVGIATTNPSTGYSETVGLGATIITFAGPGVSTDASHAGGTGVTVNAASGIATVYIAGGGSGGGFQTIIAKDSTTVGSGGQSTFTSSSGYNSGYINVYVNGAKLNSADFTETDAAGGTIELASAAVEGDIVELENFAVTAITGDVETLITKEEYTVTTASQTVFNLTAEYTSGYIDVYLNGVRLSSSDYTETNSTRITLATGATFGDVLEFVIYEKRAISELQPIWRNDGVGGGSGGIYTFTSVGIGTSAQTAFVDIYGGMKVRAGVVTIANSASADILRITDGGVNVVSGVTTIAGDLDVNGTGTHDIFGTVSLDNVQVAAGVTMGGTLEVNGDGHDIAGTIALDNVNTSGIITANSVVLSQNLTVGNNLEVTGNLTVNGTTSILDTTVQEVDLLNIQANSSTPAIGVTQSGAGPIIAAYDGATEVFRINQYGTLGVGCIPNDFQNNFDAVQIGGNLVLNVDSTGAGAGVYMSNNVYRDRTDSRWEYINTDEATQYLQANGEHIWRYAGSGTADTVITWSEALRIDTSGQVGVGTDDVNYDFHVHDSSGSCTIQLTNLTGSTTADGARITASTSGILYLENLENAATILTTNDTERLRITSGGNVNIGGNYTQTTYTSQITGTLNVTGNITQNGTPLASSGKAIAMAMIFG